MSTDVSVADDPDRRRDEAVVGEATLAGFVEHLDTGELLSNAPSARVGGEKP